VKKFFMTGGMSTNSNNAAVSPQQPPSAKSLAEARQRVAQRIAERTQCASATAAREQRKRLPGYTASSSMFYFPFGACLLVPLLMLFTTMSATYDGASSVQRELQRCELVIYRAEHPSYLDVFPVLANRRESTQQRYHWYEAKGSDWLFYSKYTFRIHGPLPKGQLTAGPGSVLNNTSVGCYGEIAGGRGACSLTQTPSRDGTQDGLMVGLIMCMLLAVFLGIVLGYDTSIMQQRYLDEICERDDFLRRCNYVPPTATLEDIDGFLRDKELLKTAESPTAAETLAEAAATPD
jgi:hypothetical protein